VLGIVRLRRADHREIRRRQRSASVSETKPGSNGQLVDVERA
jgi:hypothetical protein